MVESGGNGNPPKKSDPKEDKVRATRERQAEERLRRLEELKRNALEAQQVREQKEADRRRRLDDLRLKENERRALVETRKKEIWEAERDRRESILRKNMERDARMDAKRRNERSSIMPFAFGSSTPRHLETADSAVSTYWGPRRATSTANLRLFPANTAMTESAIEITSGAASRRPSEREQEPKKRAVSAGGLYRSPSDKMSSSMYEVFHWGEPCSVEPPPKAADVEDNWNVPRVGRRKTDLVPTTPSPRDPTASRPGSGSRSLARTPGDVTPSRPGSVMSQSSILSTSLSRPRTAPRKPRPSSIHVTGLSKDKLLSPSEDKPKLKEIKTSKPPPPKPPVTKKQNQQKNEEIKKSQSKAPLEDNKKIVENITVVESNRKTVDKQEIVTTATTVVNETTEKLELVLESLQNDKKVLPPSESVQKDVVSGETKEADDSGVSLLVDFSSPPVDFAAAPVPAVPEVPPVVAPAVVLVPTPAVPTVAAPVVEGDASSQCAEIDAAVKAPKPLANTEEEARAKLAERRRLAREQAEREAEAERQRIAREEAEEEERLRKEEEEQRRMEEEQLRLIEEARKGEEQRLMLAIQEAQKREEEEKERKRQEEQARLEKEETEKLAREEVERQRLEMAERLKKEEEERQARRKRVEAIMKRTRNAPTNNSVTKTECEKGEQDGAEREKDDSKGNLEAFLHGERLSADQSLTNGQAAPNQNIPTKIESSHSNGVSPSGLASEDCVETPLIAFQGSKETPLPADLMA